MFDRVSHASFAEGIRDDPASVPAYLEILARLQASIHAHPGCQFGSLKARLATNIAGTELLDEARRQALLRGLAEMSDGDRLCHGDFHPINVLGETAQRSHGQWLADELQVADLRGLLEDVAENAGVDRQRLDLKGSSVVVKPAQTMALNLTFHELCTNATKYGALATEKGRVDVTWAVESGNQVRLLWKESGGPAAEPPDQKGFGLQLIETLCPFELHGTAEVRFAPDGLECELTFPIA